MNSTNVSPLQVYQSTEFAGMSEENHLSNALLTEPAKMGSVLSYAFGRTEGSVLSLLTGGIGNTEFISNREYEWDLHVDNNTVVDIIENSPQATSQTPGYGGQEIELILAENFYGPGDNLVLDKNEYVVRVSREPIAWGAGWKYYVQNTNPNPTAFIPGELISVGARVSKDYNTQAEHSRRGTSDTFRTPVKLRNQLTILRKTYEVTRSAAKSIMVIELQDSEDPTKRTKLWTKLVEWTAMAKWYKEIDASLLYSTYNKNSLGMVTLQGDNKRPVYTGAGLREQISPSNKRFYTKLTYEILSEFLLDLSYCATKWGGNHKFVALTGKMGMQEFDRAIKAHAAGNNITVTTAGTFISGTGSELNFGGYFQNVTFLNNITLSVKEFPPYDDTERNRELHPISQRPVESYRFTFLNFGYKSGEANIKKVARTGSEMGMWHVAGSVNHLGDVANSMGTMRSSGIDGYEVHFISECGIKVSDPLSCGELILRIG